MKPGLLFFACAVFSTGLVACVYENEPPRRLAPEPAPYEPAPTSGETGETGGVAPEPGATNATPMLAVIDTDQTMDAAPGEGVGVFAEYASGGHWYVWWTCDTARTRQSCDFAIRASVTGGEITNADSSQLQGGEMNAPDASTLEARIRTASEVHGVAFDTRPGAIVTLRATLGGVTDGSYLFFVQDGKVNGGYPGRVTNPLQLRGKTP